MFQVFFFDFLFYILGPFRGYKGMVFGSFFSFFFKGFSSVGGVFF